MRSFIALAAAFALSGCAASTAQTPSNVLPLRSLRLYETGVGYFERSGQVAASTTLPVPASHLDDALKSLVVMGSQGQTEVLGIEFRSSLSKGMAKALSGLPLGGDDPVSFKEIVTSLRGEALVVTTTTGVVEGRLVELSTAPLPPQPPPPADASASKKPEPEGDKTPRDELFLVLLTQQGELRRVRAADVKALRPVDASFGPRLEAALDALSPRHAQVRRGLRLLGDTRGPVTFGYVAETPVWRTTYRLVSDSKARASVLQGWALLHNDTDEDWREVKLELVNGRPDSFLFPMASPRYLRRELLHPEDPLSTVPQLLGQTADELWGDNDGTGTGIGLGGMSTSGTGSGMGYGSGSGRLSGAHVSTTGASTLLSVGNLASLSQASGTEQGALFSYAVKKPISLSAHSSALVPFVEQRLDVEPIAWLGDGIGGGARTAVRFTNTTGQTLPAGTVAFFRDGGFAGESALDRLKPGERRFISFGQELDVEVTEKEGATFKDEIKRVSSSNDQLEEHFLRTTEHRLTLENRSTQARAVFITLSLGKNASITGADELDYDTHSSKPIAIFKLAAGKKIEQKLVTVEGLSHRRRVGQLSREQLEKLSQAKDLPQAERDGLRELINRRSEELEAEQQGGKLAEAVEAEEKEITRLREHLKALGDKGHVPDTHPFVKRLLAAEDRLTATKAKVAENDKLKKSKAEAVKNALRALSPDKK